MKRIDRGGGSGASSYGVEEDEGGEMEDEGEQGEVEGKDDHKEEDEDEDDGDSIYFGFGVEQNFQKRRNNLVGIELSSHWYQSLRGSDIISTAIWKPIILQAATTFV